MCEKHFSTFIALPVWIFKCKPHLCFHSCCYDKLTLVSYNDCDLPALNKLINGIIPLRTSGGSQRHALLLFLFSWSGQRSVEWRVNSKPFSPLRPQPLTAGSFLLTAAIMIVGVWSNCPVIHPDAHPLLAFWMVWPESAIFSFQDGQRNPH